ncbi:YtxH domain-containing protein [Streptococcus iniae]|uniref:YtxH domain-containing protein n=1 Tax=Streptococcus iniae TaxID=1346 RepID=UPI002B2E231C|nr:YtxH domain-containing protein [Streptococcus iniae]WNZ95307.1 YtxH domain-containing protein [Streptococcus iniae]WNZ96804.1 YtxH domain-containing protein [Streptococcus iniae]
MGNFFKSLVIGTATGVATAYFLSTEQGKKVKTRVEKAIEAYKENPDDYHQMAKEKGQEYTHLAKETFNDYKQKFESGELTKDQVFDMVKEKTSDFVHKFSELATDLAEEDDTVVENDDDIIIDITKKEETLEEDDVLATDSVEVLIPEDEEILKTEH